MERNEVWDELSPKSKEKIFALLESWMNKDWSTPGVYLIKSSVIYEIFGEEAFSNQVHNLHRELNNSSAKICETLNRCIQNGRRNTSTSEREQCSTEGDPKVP